MPLPISGQISFNDMRVEMSQSVLTNYDFREWANGARGNTGVGTIFAPVNVHTGNSNRNDQYNLDRWHGYSGSAHYGLGPTAETVTISPINDYGDYWYTNSGMILFDAGTGIGTIPVTVTVSTNNMETQLINKIEFFHGKPWADGGSDNSAVWNADLFKTYAYTSYGSTFTDNFYYDHTYTAAKGRFVYVVLSSLAVFPPPL
jgi:hypothetical protein